MNPVLLNGSGSWAEVTQSEPCPACGKSDWCARSTDGQKLSCRRVASCDLGEGRHQVAADQADCWIYSLTTTGLNSSRPTPPPPPPTAKRADADRLHTIYSKLLKLLPLTEKHRTDLRRRGLTDQAIERNGYGSLGIDRSRTIEQMLLVFGDELASVPGFAHDAESGRWRLLGAAGLLVPCRDRQGRIVALKVRRDEPGTGGKYAYLSSKRLGGLGPGSPVHWPLVDHAGERVVRITEGELKADVATELTGVLTLSLPGVATWRRAVEAAKELAAEKVLLAFDCDWQANPHVGRPLLALVKALKREGITTVLESWPQSHGKGIDDVLAAGHKPKELSGPAMETALQGAALPRDAAPQAANDHRPEIELTAREFEVVGQVIKALAANKVPIYQRAGQLVTITTEATSDKRLNRPAASPIISPLPPARLRTLITESARLVKVKADGTTAEANPPQWLVLGVDAAGEWPGIRPLTGITETPILRPDGTVLQTPGYDPATGILFCPYGPTDPVPDHPDKADAEAARDLLLETVRDFPFAGEIDKAGWLALVLTVLARQAFAGPAPLFLIDANTRGSGKGKLADVAGKITTGRGFARTAATRDDDEMRKAITTLALQGERTVLFDNIAGTLGNASLDAALTADEWQCRILGSNYAPRLPLAVTWLATGNNVALAADTARRVCRIRLESPLEKPEERADFRHTDLLGYVQRNRARLAAAALTILRAWFVAGQPKQPLTPWGSFEAWSDLVRQAVAWVGLPDPGDGRQELQAEADLEGNLLRLLIAGIENADPERQGLKVADMIRLAEEHPDEHPALKAAVDEITPLGKKPSAKGIGLKLHHLRRRVVDGKYLQDARDRTNTTVWVVCESGIAGFAGSIGSIQSISTHARTRTRASEHRPGVRTSDTSFTSCTAGSDHEPHEITTSDGWLRTECRRCGAVLEKDRPPE